MTNYLDYDAELRLHNEVLSAAYGIRRADNVLDIGCGTGETTREAARMALDGSVLGVDVSAPMIERARELSHAEGLQNVLFEVADAQVHTLRPDHFDIAISRFGTMFFADAVAAFGNIVRALRPGGRRVRLRARTLDHERNGGAYGSCFRRALPRASAPNPCRTPARGRSVV